ncbi:hypothetical protein N665_0178s0006 [Sinapis alba]|nr:hypothetical protein N665_0178s0006 [Sinapis alba]
MDVEGQVRDIKSLTPDQNGLGRRLPGGSWDLYARIVPTFCSSNKVWDVDIDDIYALVNFKNSHWFAIWISISKKCASFDEERIKYTLEPFIYERVKVGVPQCRGGDCGVYTLKYIECHALGMPSFSANFCDKNVRVISEKMGHNIYHETLGFEDIKVKESNYKDLDTCE